MGAAAAAAAVCSYKHLCLFLLQRPRAASNLKEQWTVRMRMMVKQQQQLLYSRQSTCCLITNQQQPVFGTKTQQQQAAATNPAVQLSLSCDLVQVT